MALKPSEQAKRAVKAAKARARAQGTKIRGPKNGYPKGKNGMALPGWKQRFIDALAEEPIVKYAAKRAGVSRRHVYDAMKADPEFKALVDLAREDGIDEVDATLFRMAKKNNVIAAIHLSKVMRYNNPQKEEDSGDKTIKVEFV